MKKIYFLLLLVSATAAAQITTPSPIFACDPNGDGFTIFDLTSKNEEILNGENPDSYTIRFYLSLADAGSNSGEILPQTTFANTTVNNQVVFVRVDDLVTSMMTIMELELVVNPVPTASITGTSSACLGGAGSVVFTAANGTPPYIFTYSIEGNTYQVTSPSESIGIVLPADVPGAFTVTLGMVHDSSNGNCESIINEQFAYFVSVPPAAIAPPALIVTENPFDGIATFDLTSQETIIGDGQSGLGFSYFLTESDAAANIATIASPNAFVNTTNPQTIYVRVYEPISGCFSITNFDVFVNNATNPVVYIPDFNFKDQLLNAGLPEATFILGADNLPVIVDVNDDGEIQYDEALLVYTIELPQFNIATMEGVQHFTNLRRLNLADNNLNSIDVSMLTNLEYISVSDNELMTFDVSGLSLLQEVLASDNNLTSFDFSGCPALEMIGVDGNSLTELNITGFANLVHVTCYGNAIPVLDLSAASNLETLFCSSNLITDLNLSATTNLQVLDCGSNAISSLDLSGLSSLATLWIDYNPIASIDISMLENLANFSAAGVPLTTLDASNNPNLCNFFGVSGPNLEYINIKNGASCAVTNILIENPNLQFVCADAEDVSELSDYFAANDMTVNVNSYCSFTPGGDHNTITGTVRLDIDNNGCAATDPTFPFIKLRITDVGGAGVTFTQADGTYSFYTQDGNYTVAPEFENPLYYNLFTPVPISFPTTDNLTATQDFCIVPNGVHPDLEIAIMPLVSAQPGFDAIYKIVYKNKGNQVVSGNVFFEFDNNVMTLISSLPAADNTLPGYIGFSFTDMLPFENRTIIVTLNINAPTDTPPVNINDVLTYTAAAVISATDDTPADNLFVYEEAVTGSFDPNNVICVEGDSESTDAIGDYLHYIINFENTGTAPAQNIVVHNAIDPTQYDIESLQILNSSHPMVAHISENENEFIFEGINLESGGHGNILMKIKSVPTLEAGDAVANQANIFFDYNFPVATNVYTTVFESLSVDAIDSDKSLRLFPNPSQDRVTVNSENEIESIDIYDIQGRLLQSARFSQKEILLDVSNRSAGVYFLKITTSGGIGTVKMIRR